MPTVITLRSATTLSVSEVGCTDVRSRVHVRGGIDDGRAARERGAGTRHIHFHRYPGPRPDLSAWHDEYPCDTREQRWEGSVTLANLSPAGRCRPGCAGPAWQGCARRVRRRQRQLRGDLRVGPARGHQPGHRRLGGGQAVPAGGGAAAVLVGAGAQAVVAALSPYPLEVPLRAQRLVAAERLGQERPAPSTHGDVEIRPKRPSAKGPAAQVLPSSREPGPVRRQVLLQEPGCSTTAVAPFSEEIAGVTAAPEPSNLLAAPSRRC